VSRSAPVDDWTPGRIKLCLEGPGRPRITVDALLHPCGLAIHRAPPTFAQAAAGERPKGWRVSTVKHGANIHGMFRENLPTLKACRQLVQGLADVDWGASLAELMTGPEAKGLGARVKMLVESVAGCEPPTEPTKPTEST